MIWSTIAVALFSFSLAGKTSAQVQPPSTYPHNYTGIPPGDYSPDWQTYYEVTEPLPNVTWSLPRSFAGNIGVNRAGHPNDTLFFWGFERQNGSLTAQAGDNNDEPWLIWLNGGPGASSFLGFMSENGPLHVTNTYSIVANNYSWNTLTDAFWIDQPVGTGFSTTDSNGYIADEDQMGQDFLGFLTNLVKVFPSLISRPLFLTGESYAGTYIPYITKALFSTPNPPVKLKKTAIGDGAIGNYATFAELPVLTVIETYPQLINFDTDVYEYFRTQEHLCGYDLHLTYPQTGGNFPTLDIYYNDGTQSSIPSFDRSSSSSLSSKSLWRQMIVEQVVKPGEITQRDLQTREEKRQTWKRELSGRANGSIDPWYGCYLFEEMLDYAVNFSFPWTNGGFDVYDIPDALNPEAPSDASIFMNDEQTRTALHAPTSFNWSSQINYPFGSTYNYVNGSNVYGDPSVEPMAFLTDLATNASANNVSMIFYSGNDDSFVSHRGTEVVIQNMTFGGIQGFSRQPATSWSNDKGDFAGIVHQERNVTYALFVGAGHLVPEQQPQNALVFLREFILGSNETGLVTGSSGSMQGGKDSALEGDVLPGTDVIFYGSGTTVSSTIAPSATIAAWERFLATATVMSSATASSGTSTPATSGAGRLGVLWGVRGLLAVLRV